MICGPPSIRNPACAYAEPLAVHVLLQLVIFMTKQKYLEQIFERIISYCENITQGNVLYLTSPYLSQVTYKT